MTRQQIIISSILGVAIVVAVIMLITGSGKPPVGSDGKRVSAETDSKAVPPPPPPPEPAVVKVEADWSPVALVAKDTKRSEEWVPVWFEVPKQLEAMQFTKPKPYQGALTFTVEKAGLVTVAVPLVKWGDADHSGGPWTKELLSREKLPELGWKEEGTLNGGEYLLLTRECKAGETFTLRTRKYSGPVLFKPR